MRRSKKEMWGGLGVQYCSRGKAGPEEEGSRKGRGGRSNLFIYQASQSLAWSQQALGF